MLVSAIVLKKKNRRETVYGQNIKRYTLEMQNVSLMNCGLGFCFVLVCE